MEIHIIKMDMAKEIKMSIVIIHMMDTYVLDGEIMKGNITTRSRMLINSIIRQHHNNNNDTCRICGRKGH